MSPNEISTSDPSVSLEVLAMDDFALRVDLVRLFLERYLSRYGHRVLATDMAVAPEEVESSFAARCGTTGDTNRTELRANIEQKIAAIRARLLDVGDAAAAHGLDLPFQHLQRALDCPPEAIDLLTAQLAIQTDIDLHRLARFCWADFVTNQPKVGFLLELVAVDGQTAHRLTHVLGVGGPLRRFGIIELSQSDRWRPSTPLLHQGAVIPEEVALFLRGYSGSPSASEVWKMHSAPSPQELVYSEPFRGEVEAAMAAAYRRRDSRLRLVLVGAAGTGRVQLVKQLANVHERRVVTLDLRRVRAMFGDRPSTDRGDRLPRATLVVQEALRTALLTRSVLVTRHAEVLDDDIMSEGPGHELLDLFRAFPDLVVFIAEHTVHRLSKMGEHLEIHATHIGAATQQALWLNHLRDEVKIDAPETLAAEVVGRHSLTPGAIHSVLEQARHRAQNRRGACRRLKRLDIIDAAREHFQADVSNLAEVVTTQLEWDDLVLPTKTKSRLNAVIAAVRNRFKVLDEWGFARRLDRGRGLSCLLSGAPGTGKTTAALLLAKEMGREVYRIDLSKVVDKYIGETEKNIGRIFDHAERSQACLLFDEADSLFAKRTKVTSANDRYANLEVNYLLQRLESFDGFCLLTTNFESSLDEAFKRRIPFRLTFESPDPEQRARLWQAMFPAAVPVAEGADWDLLAEHFDLSGGGIKNAVLAACYAAAEEGTDVHMRHMVQAAVHECEEMGILVRSDLVSDFEDGGPQ